ncbi:MAG TPA: porin family protein [Flavobacterium sp.]|nr:porin family protein [Flavobacterium sp.]
MRNTILSIFIAFAINSYAQSLDCGIKGGANFNIAEFNKENSIDFYAGGFAEYHFNNKISLQPELIYNRIKYVNGYHTYKHDYISLPIGFNYKIIEKLKVNAGFQFSYLLKSTTVLEASDWGPGFDPVVSGSELKFDTTDDYKNSYDVFLGASYNFWNNFHFDVRYFYGLNNVSVTSLNKNMYLNILQIGLSYKF